MADDLPGWEMLLQRSTSTFQTPRNLEPNVRKWSLFVFFPEVSLIPCRGFFMLSCIVWIDHDWSWWIHGPKVRTSLCWHDLPSPRIALQEPIRLGIQAVDGKKPLPEGYPHENHRKTKGKLWFNGILWGLSVSWLLHSKIFWPLNRTRQQVLTFQPLPRERQRGMGIAFRHAQLSGTW